MRALPQRTWLYLIVCVAAFFIATVYADSPYSDGVYVWFALTTGILLLSCLSFVAGLIMILFGRYWFGDPMKFWVSTVVILSFLVLSLGAFHFWYISNPQEIAKAKEFVAVADPALEAYHQQHGKYPNSLSDLHLGVSAPFWLLYESDNVGGQEWDFPTGHQEQYRFTFGGLCYRGCGEWMIGGI
jgi:hypothetical protein